jgi:hypothetical protein
MKLTTILAAIVAVALAATAMTTTAMAKNKTIISEQTVPRLNPNGEPVEGKYDCEITYEVTRQSGDTVTKTETERGACD